MKLPRLRWQVLIQYNEKICSPAELRAQGEFRSQWRRRTRSSRLCRKPVHQDGDVDDQDGDVDYQDGDIDDHDDDVDDQDDDDKGQWWRGWWRGEGVLGEGVLGGGVGYPAAAALALVLHLRDSALVENCKCVVKNETQTNKNTNKPQRQRSVYFQTNKQLTKKPRKPGVTFQRESNEQKQTKTTKKTWRKKPGPSRKQTKNKQTKL